MLKRKNIIDVIERYRVFFEEEDGLYLLRILRECDLAAEELPNEFGPLYAAYYDMFSPDGDSLQLVDYLSNQEEIIERHKNIHRFYEMLTRIIYDLPETYKIKVDGNELKFLSVKNPSDGKVTLSMPNLIIDTLGARRSISSALLLQGVNPEEYGKAYTKRRRKALDKLYTRLFYNIDLKIADYFDENKNKIVYDFSSDECFRIMDIIAETYKRGSDPISQKESRAIIRSYFNNTIQKGLIEATNDFYESVNVSAGNMRFEGRGAKLETNEYIGNVYKRVLPHTIKRIENENGEIDEYCVAPKRSYTKWYELRIGGEFIEKSKTPSFLLETGVADKYAIQVLGVSVEDDIYNAANAVKSGLYNSNNTVFMKLLGKGRSSEVKSLSNYVLRVKNAMFAIKKVNGKFFDQLGSLCDDPAQRFHALEDIYFLTKFV